MCGFVTAGRSTDRSTANKTAWRKTVVYALSAAATVRRIAELMISIAHPLDTALADSFRWACRLDVTVRKPGHVALASPDLDVCVERRLAGTAAAAPLVCAPGLRVGARIERAAAAMRAAIGDDVDLGVLLLCAPIAVAMQRLADLEENASPCPVIRRRLREAALRRALQAVLAELDADDAAAVSHVMALAEVDASSDSAAYDAQSAAAADLRAAMANAAPRDRIALQYITDFDDLFDPALTDFVGALGEPPSPMSLAAAVEDLYLGFLARFSDAHLFRTHGPALAQRVTQQAREWRRQWGTAAAAAQGEPCRRAARAAALAHWDTELRTAGVIPRTSGDLTVATVFLAACLDPRLPGLHPVDDMATLAGAP
jgi:triphosphoribosyl-dephospho-CoA synthase